MLTGLRALDNYAFMHDISNVPAIESQPVDSALIVEEPAEQEDLFSENDTAISEPDSVAADVSPEGKLSDASGYYCRFNRSYWPRHQFSSKIFPFYRRWWFSLLIVIADHSFLYRMLTNQ